MPPPLKWAGGKRWLAPSLDWVWRHHPGRRLVEPFVGGMSVALTLRPEAALLSDINTHLVNFYQWLRSADGLNTAYPVQDSSAFYAARAEFNELIASDAGAKSRRAAELFYFLNRTAFNGVCRFNASGKFNVPYGKRDNVHVPGDLRSYRDVLANWEIQCCSFEQIELRDGDFVYADPPYDEGFTTYSQGGFSWAEQERLAGWLAKHSGPVIASNHYTPRIVDLYSSLGFCALRVMAPRRINSSGDRSPKAEALFVNGIPRGLLEKAVSELPCFSARPKPAASKDIQMDLVGL